MRSTDGLMIDRAAVSALLASLLVLGKEQLDALRTELAKDPTGKGYEGKEPGDVLALLNERKIGPNPNERGKTAVQSISGKELKVWLRSVLTRALELGGTVSKKWAGLSSALVPTISDSEVINGDSKMLAGFAAQMVADGLVTAEELAALFSVPEVEWYESVLLPSRAEVVLGLEEVVLELSDLPEMLP
ncbi:hypothetical protein [Armatimonas sp.]|uniref:hypothetical protein n=1 Tax=Armatimonas sp. TaxID=1872638 RepID=UPI003750E19A